MRKVFSFTLIFLSVSLFLFAQDAPIRPGITGGAGTDALNAAEEFRLGVHAYNRFAYNEAILSFERALSFRPGEAIILDWLGRAYYRSGFEETAIRQWRAALDIYGRNSGAGMLLASRIETVSNRRFLLPVADDEVRYVEAGRYPGKYQDIVLYRQPSSVLPNSDGSAWVVAYGSNEIVKIDVNGIVRDRKRGPLNGFDRPYDLVRGLDGRLYISEYRGSRVSILDADGNWLSYLGSRGLGKGQFVGPQNLAVDEDGYLYVVDYGNRRISKFDPDGAFILSFAQKSAVFPGMLSPTGIAAGNGKIYAADNAAKAIYMFDPNGSYLGQLSAEGLKSPESIRFLPDERLLVADANRILLIEPDSAIVRELGLAGNEKVRVTGANIDGNGNILAAKFQNGEVAVMSRFDDLASGFFVQIRNVYAERFPVVTVFFTVEDRLRRPITGLDVNNFLLTEGGMDAQEQIFLSPGYRSGGADISLLVERSSVTAGMRGEFSAASRDIRAALQEMGNSKVVSVISAGAQPRREQHEPSLENAVRGTDNSFSPRWRFDQGLRLCATDLLSAAPKRSVVYIGSGEVGELAFEQYSLSELSSYLANNGIVFNAVIIGSGQASASIEYLCTATGGKAAHLYQPQGIGPLIKSVADKPCGLYSFSFTSRLPTDFGRAWLPIEIEVYLMERSGRDSTGYFPPLE
ncbi:MAG: 6-bladed beta-propeller [Treponema sp.]|jgi:DNA-binding beta-propeller fold protein YncE|nr:6-bladed beta-propeller [Treponema sp.]